MGGFLIGLQAVMCLAVLFGGFYCLWLLIQWQERQDAQLPLHERQRQKEREDELNIW